MTGRRVFTVAVLALALAAQAARAASTVMVDDAGRVTYPTNLVEANDLALQSETDAAVGLLCTIASYNALQARVAAVEGGGVAFTEVDPLAVHKSTTTQVWTHVGGTYTNEAVIATSDVSSNGFAAVTYDLATGNGMNVVVEMSDLTLTEWTAFAPFAYPGYVRISLVETLPSPAGLDTTISNIAATAWTRPDLYSNVTDTAGQIIHVDTAVEARQPVPLAQMQSAVAAVTPAAWAEYTATTNVYLGGHKIILGGGWNVLDVSGVGVLSYADWMTTTNALTIANNGTPALVMTPGQAGLEITTFALDGGTGTVGIATNGVSSEPFLQWTADLMQPDWENLAAISATYPSTNAAGDYELVAVLPGEVGFVRAMRQTGTASITLRADTTINGSLTADNIGTMAGEDAEGYVQTNHTITINGETQSLASNISFTVDGGGSSAPSAIFVPWYEQDFNDSGIPNQAQISDGTDLIYCVWQDYTNAATRLNMKLGRSVEGDVWTITHHAGPQTGTNVTFNVLYSITKGQATPTAWTYTNSVTATWNATNMYDHEIQHTLTNSIVGTNSVRLWISKGDSALGSGYWYWGDTTVEVAR